MNLEMEEITPFNLTLIFLIGFLVSIARPFCFFFVAWELVPREMFEEHFHVVGVLAISEMAQSVAWVLNSRLATVIHPPQPEGVGPSLSTSADIPLFDTVWRIAWLVIAGAAISVYAGLQLQEYVPHVNDALSGALTLAQACLFRGISLLGVFITTYGPMCVSFLCYLIKETALALGNLVASWQSDPGSSGARSHTGQWALLAEEAQDREEELLRAAAARKRAREAKLKGPPSGRIRAEFGERWEHTAIPSCVDAHLGFNRGLMPHKSIYSSLIKNISSF